MNPSSWNALEKWWVRNWRAGQAGILSDCSLGWNPAEHSPSLGLISFRNIQPWISALSTTKTRWSTFSTCGRIWVNFSIQPAAAFPPKSHHLSILELFYLLRFPLCPDRALLFPLSEVLPPSLSFHAPPELFSPFSFQLLLYTQIINIYLNTFPSLL